MHKQFKGKAFAAQQIISGEPHNSSVARGKMSNHRVPHPGKLSGLSMRSILTHFLPFLFFNSSREVP